MSHTTDFLKETCAIAHALPVKDVERLALELLELRERPGRLFFVGVGGSLATAHHAVNDFRKLCGIEAYAPQAAELTARSNDEGWKTAFTNPFWKRGDALFVLSVGGGTLQVSVPIVHAIEAALVNKVRVLGIVGRNGGYTKKYGHCVVVVPTVEPDRVTPHTESWQSVVLHLLVSHPKLQLGRTRW